MAQTANSNTISRFKGKPKTKIKLVDIQVGWSERFGAYTTAAKCCGRKSRQPLPVNQVMAAAASTDQPRIELSQNDDQQAKDQQQSEQTSSELSCIREVEHNFLNLVSYNKLQLFYIGTLIYSVMNIAFIFYYSTIVVTSSTSTSKLPAGVQLAEKSNYLKPAATHSTPPDHLYYLDPEAARFLLAALLPLTLLLGLIAAITALRFAQKLSTWLVVAAWKRRRPRRKRKSEVEEEKNVSERWSEEDTTATLQTLGLILSLLLLYLPLLPLPKHSPASTAQLDQDQLTRQLNGRQVNGDSNSAVDALNLATNLPLAATLTLIYLTPHLLDGARLFVCLTALLPLALFALLRIATPLLNHFQRAPTERHLSLKGDYSDYEYLSVLFAAALPLTIAFGLLKRSQWWRSLSRDTFAGASELIEAKVSLEHQRQQQETLLLSVLPAYVAEQVKRNMLKKTNTALVQPQPQQPSIASTTAVSSTLSPTNNQQQQQQQQQPEVVTVFSALVAGNHFRTSECDDPLSRKWPLRNSSGQQRLHPSLVSGVSVDTTHSFSGAITPLIKTNSLSHTNLPLQVNHHHHHQHSVAMSTGGAGGTSGAVGSNNRRGFNELYIRTYNNVSLLYGDIVGFTRLCTQLSSSQLVRVLNDLFSHFDYLAEKHKIMRIKILGDCYYGVGGIPEFAVMGAKSRATNRQDNHAVNCVNMGLDMIHYIRCLNIERASCASNEQQQQQQQQLNQLSSGHNTPLPQFELNMRIGVHTGHIHSGVIGLKKWQFDVWSNDVSIAMHSESSGIPGRVQVTEATLTQLNGAFTYESAPGCLSDSFLCANDIRTYLIRDRVLRSNQLPTHLQQPQVCTLEKKRAAAAAREVEPRDEDNIRAATIGTIRQTLLAADNSSGGWQGSGSVSSTGGFNHHDLTWLTLTYRDAAMRKLHRQQPIAHLLRELLRLELLVGICLPLIFLYNKTSTTTITTALSMPLATCVLILVLISIFARNSSDETSTTTTTKPTKTSATGGASGGHHSSLTVERKKRKWMSSIEAKLAKPFTCLACLTPVKQRSAIRSISVTLLLMVVILVQLLLVAKRTCGGANKWWSPQQQQQQQHQVSITDTKPPELQQVSLLSEQYQLTVILLLISIDSSVHLLSYKIKCCLLIGSLCIHLLLMLQPTTLLHNTICRLQITTFTDVEHQQQQQQQQDNSSSNLNQQVVLIAAAANQSLIEWSSNLMILLLALCSFGFARQLDYNNKTSFLWRNRLSVDHEELEYISSINKLLLENILPSHVVQYYLTQPATGCSSNNQLPNVQSYMRMSFSNMRTINNELYHEQHEHVAVMFASIPHFYEFYDESDISKQGLGCIALLNEIICDFDKLLLKNKFSRIEKIKTIGSTYMAAAGLRPCYLSASRGSSASNQSAANHQHRPSTGAAAAAAAGGFHQQQVGARLRTTQSARIAATSSTGASAAAAAAAHLLLCEHDERKLALSQQKLNLICMIQFASSLMTALNGINKQSFQVFKLRVGVNTGSVIAGVIGAQRPFYDIWGDCVNIASRMESLGEVGRIQVEEKTAKLLMENLCADTYSIVKRGPIDVKGKGGMLTYFVDKKNMSNNNNNTTTAESSVPATSASGKQQQ